MAAFDGERWFEDLRPAGEATRERLVPRGAHDRSQWIKQDVTVERLGGRHVVGASIPVAYDVDAPEGVEYLTDGISVVPFLRRPLQRGQTYTVWSYAPRPAPEELASVPARYPPALRTEGYFDLEGGTGYTPAAIPPFGAARRDATIRRLATLDETAARYAPLYERARAVTRRARSPYAAAVALEAWFRSTGGFVYDEQPPLGANIPPLVSFVTESKRGYCQHFAGAMALMLRYLGIPARVAAGFTSGKYEAERGEWVVRDRNAHTWVEVWFPRYGWLPFDPTPGRGRLTGAYSGSSPAFRPAVLGALLGGALLGRRGRGDDPLGRRMRVRDGVAPAAPPQAAAGGRSDGFPTAPVAALGVLLLGVGVPAGKLARRRLRYVTRDPRRVASACHREFAELLRDQRLERGSASTVSELGDVVRQRLGLEPARFVRAVTAARFGPPDTAPLEARRARGELIALRSAIRRRLTRRERLRGLVSLRSLGATA